MIQFDNKENINFKVKFDYIFIIRVASNLIQINIRSHRKKDFERIINKMKKLFVQASIYDKQLKGDQNR